MKVFYSARYEVSLPGHIWPTDKYRLIAAQLARGPFQSRLQFQDVRAAPWDDLALVHTSEYLSKLRTGALTPDEIATLELPWLPEFADAFRLMVGGTCAAGAAALQDGRAAHLGGGLHHAFPNHGEGFCPLNDVAVAIRVLQRPSESTSSDRVRRIRRAAVVDCDVHHGNGTAMIFERDPSVFTFSIHQQHNYPLFKPRSCLDVGLEDGVGDDRYLGALSGALPQVFASGPDLVMYLAGADPFEEDRLGGLKVTKKGLAERDRLVLDAADRVGAPLCTVLAGGYAANVHDTVAIHVATVAAMAG